jgi:hypothetical protein
MNSAAVKPDPEITIIHPVADVDEWLKQPGRSETFIRFLVGAKGGNS